MTDQITSPQRRLNRPKTDYNRRVMYKYYIDSLDSHDKKIYNVDYKQYSNIITEFNKLIIDRILDGEIFKLPNRLGIIRIVKKKRNLKYLSMDYGHFRKTGNRIFHLNEHSNGDNFRFYWKKGSVKSITLYSFKAVRDKRRAIAKKVKSGFKDYLPL